MMQIVEKEVKYIYKLEGCQKKNSEDKIPNCGRGTKRGATIRFAEANAQDKEIWAGSTDQQAEEKKKTVARQRGRCKEKGGSASFYR